MEYTKETFMYTADLFRRGGILPEMVNEATTVALEGVMRYRKQPDHDESLAVNAKDAAEHIRLTRKIRPDDVKYISRVLNSVAKSVGD